MHIIKKILNNYYLRDYLIDNLNLFEHYNIYEFLYIHEKIKLLMRDYKFLIYKMKGDNNYINLNTFKNFLSFCQMSTKTKNFLINFIKCKDNLYKPIYLYNHKISYLYLLIFFYIHDLVYKNFRGFFINVLLNDARFTNYYRYFYIYLYNLNYNTIHFYNNFSKDDLLKFYKEKLYELNFNHP